MIVTEYVFVSGDSCETFCRSCGQLRLWAKPEQPTACGHCNSADIVIGPLFGDELNRLRDAWRNDRARLHPFVPDRKRYSCLHPLDADHDLDEEPARCGEPEAYRAAGDAPAYAHLCSEHWSELPEERQALYVQYREEAP